MLVLGALIMAVMLASLDTTIIATALPTIAGEFNAFESFAWVGTAYIVTSTIATPLLGKLSDLYGRRVVFQTTMGVFLVGSVLCGLAQSMGQLIAFRAVQGVGGGAIQALAFAILGDILPPRERGRYIGYFTIAFAAAALLGPLVGGFIIDHFTWPWLFFINIPFCLAVAVVCHHALRLPFPRRRAKLDVLGAALLSGGLASLMIGLAEADDGWRQNHVVSMLVAAGVLLVLFVLQERRAAEPMIPMRLFGNPVILASVTIGFFAGAITYGTNQFLPLYFQDSLFVSPTESGLRVMPMMIGITATSFGVGRLIARSGRYRRYPIIGGAVGIVGIAAITRIDGGTAYWTLVLPMVLTGIAMGSMFTSTSIASQNAVAFSDLGVATATVMFFRSLGGSIALACFGTVLNSTIRHEIPARTGVPADAAADLIREPAQIRALPDDVRTAVIDSIALGVSRIYWISTGCMAAAFVAALLLRERVLRDRAGITDALEGATV